MRVRLASLHGALLLSGAAALVYESSWTRMLHRVFGVGDLAVATVLGAFFLGLGLGSAAAARLAPRARRPAAAYVALELGIGLYALGSLWLIPQADLAYAALGRGASFELLTLFRVGLSLLLLLPPTLLMGATLPVAALILWRGREAWARGVTGLYVSNTAGAILGAAAAGFWLLPRLGTRWSVILAGLASFAAAGWVALALRAERGDAEAPAPIAAAASRERAPRGAAAGIGLATALAALTGMAALAGEVLWTRVLRTLVHGTTQAFAAMLVNYLLGIALGGLLARRLARGRLAPEIWLGALQIAGALFAVASMALVPELPRLLPLLRGEPDLHVHETWIVLLFGAVLLLPLASLVGTGLPLAWAIGEGAQRDAGAGSGRILAANTLGALAGSLLAGFALIPAAGTEASLLLVVLLQLFAAALAFRAVAGDSRRRRLLALAGPLALAALLLVARPSLELPFLLGARERPLEAALRGPDESYRAELAFFAEGRNTTVTVVRAPGGLRLYNDGLPQSGLALGAPGFGAELALLGALPTLFSAGAERALVIGLGGGHTASVMLAGPWRQIEVVELEAAVIDAARVLHAELARPFPLDDPRVALVVDDGRNRVALSEPGSLDAVVSQPSHPWLAGSSALYTAEFFRDVERALRPGGVFVLWVNLFRMDDAHLRSVVGTLADVFPHVLGFVVEESSLVLCAAQTPLAWGDPLPERLRDLTERGGFLAPLGFASAPELLARLELDPAGARAFGAGAPRIVDDRPLLEFELARLPHRVAFGVHDLDRGLADIPWLGADTSSLLGSELLSRGMLARIERVSDRRVALERVAATPARLPRDARLLVEGRLSEAGGDVEQALASYDASATPEAAELADALRLAEGRAAAALEVAAARATAARSAEPLLLAALELGTPSALRSALEIARRSGGDGDAPLRSRLEALDERGCGGLSEHPGELERLARERPALAFAAERCAFERGELEQARSLSRLHADARRAAAAEAFTRGEAAVAGGNAGGAELLLRRALRLDPGHAQAQAALASLLERLEAQEAGAGRASSPQR